MGVHTSKDPFQDTKNGTKKWHRHEKEVDIRFLKIHSVNRICVKRITIPSLINIKISEMC